MQKSLDDLYAVYDILDNDTKLVVECIQYKTSWDDKRRKLMNLVVNLDHQALHKYTSEILDMNYGIILKWKKENRCTK